MPYTSKIRERIIRMLWNESGLVTLRHLEQSFDKSRRRAALDEISLLVSEGVLHRIGSGRRGDPFKLLLSRTYPFKVFCPLCKQSISPAVTNEYPA